MLLEHAASGVFQRHVPATEGRELGTERRMTVIQRGVRKGCVMPATYRVGYRVQHPNRRHAEGAVKPQ